MYDKILLRFGEVGLKGKNRSWFISKLNNNIRRRLKPVAGDVKITSPFGRIYIDLEPRHDFAEIAKSLKRVFGLVSFSPVAQVPLEIQAIREKAAQVLAAGGLPATFKVETNRPLKTFPLNSMEISRDVGGFLLQKFPSLKVDVHNPEKMVEIDVRSEGAFVFADTIPGPGGLPVGVTGKGMLLLSGGIDSPVAGWLAMKRGIELEAIYFDTPPFTSPRSLAKVEKLAQILSQWGRVTLHIVNFTPVQRALMEHCPEDLTITVMRRFMYRVAEALAKKQEALALITGENVAQVASQTLESMYTINHCIETPVLRPVVTMDKVEIIDLAKKIGTYETSVEPYQDCCALFVSRNPKTRPTIAQAEAAEERLEIQALVELALSGITTHTYRGYLDERR